jgi:hypothetical protein
MGNHEGSGALFKKYFPYPFVSARYWSFDYGPAHFVCIDQYRNYFPGSNQHTWLGNDLAATTKPWKFVFFHEPGWSAGGHSNNLSVQNYIQPYCEEHGVAMVFAGHNHYYARAEVNGVQHVTTGGGGAPLYDPNPSYPNVVTSAKEHHFCKVEIDDAMLHMSVITKQDSLIDSLTIMLPGAGVGPDGREALTERISLDAGPSDPVTGHVEIAFSTYRDSRVSLAVYDVKGHKVKTLVRGKMEPGDHTVTWNGKDDSGAVTSSGIYFCRLEVGRESAATKLIRLR